MFRYLTISFASISLIIASFLLSATPVLADHDGYPVSCSGDAVVADGRTYPSGARVRDFTVVYRCDSGRLYRNDSPHFSEDEKDDRDDALVAIIVVAGIIGLGYWAFSGGDENSFISFKPMEQAGPIYGQARQWIGVEHDVSQNVKVSLGSFWFVSDDVASILPSAENIGSELVFALGDRKSAKGELALTASAFFNDQSANLDDSLRVATDRFGVWDERVALTYRKAF